MEFQEGGEETEKTARGEREGGMSVGVVTVPAGGAYPSSRLADAPTPEAPCWPRGQIERGSQAGLIGRGEPWAGARMPNVKGGRRGGLETAVDLERWADSTATRGQG